MSIRVATVLSARDWEPGLVAYARETAELLIVLRAFQPHEIEEHAAELRVLKYLPTNLSLADIATELANRAAPIG